MSDADPLSAKLDADLGKREVTRSLSATVEQVDVVRESDGAGKVDAQDEDACALVLWI